MDDDERSVDSQSAGSLEEFIVDSDHSETGDEKGESDTALTRVSAENICMGKRKRRETNRFLPENYDTLMLESCSSLGSESEDGMANTDDDDEWVASESDPESESESGSGSDD